MSEGKTDPRETSYLMYLFLRTFCKIYSRYITSEHVNSNDVGRAAILLYLGLDPYELTRALFDSCSSTERV